MIRLFVRSSGQVGDLFCHQSLCHVDEGENSRNRLVSPFVNPIEGGSDGRVHHGEDAQIVCGAEGIVGTQ